MAIPYPRSSPSNSQRIQANCPKRTHNRQIYSGWMNGGSQIYWEWMNGITHKFIGWMNNASYKFFAVVGNMDAKSPKNAVNG